MANKISPCLWFDGQAEAAANFYTSVFKNSKILAVSRYGEGMPMPAGTALTVNFSLDGQEFVALNGGPEFTFNPSVSIFVNCESKEEVDDLWGKLSAGGKALMPLDAYPFSPRFGWVQDKYGLSWQLILSSPEGEWRPRFIPSLLFVGDNCGRAEEAIDFYVGTLPGSRTGQIVRYGAGQQPDREGTVMFADFRLGNEWFAAMDSAHEHDFAFNESVSFMIDCADQEEIDEFWDKLTADGGEPRPCGWLKDKFGLSWQVVPAVLGQWMQEGDPERGNRVGQAIMQMGKLDIAKLRDAYEGVPV